MSRTVTRYPDSPSRLYKRRIALTDQKWLCWLWLYQCVGFLIAYVCYRLLEMLMDGYYDQVVACLLGPVNDRAIIE